MKLFLTRAMFIVVSAAAITSTAAAITSNAAAITNTAAAITSNHAAITSTAAAITSTAAAITSTAGEEANRTASAGVGSNRQSGTDKADNARCLQACGHDWKPLCYRMSSEDGRKHVRGFPLDQDSVFALPNQCLFEQLQCYTEALGIEVTQAACPEEPCSFKCISDECVFEDICDNQGNMYENWCYFSRGRCNAVQNGTKFDWIDCYDAKPEDGENIRGRRNSGRKSRRFERQTFQRGSRSRRFGDVIRHSFAKFQWGSSWGPADDSADQRGVSEPGSRRFKDVIRQRQSFQWGSSWGPADDSADQRDSSRVRRQLDSLGGGVIQLFRWGSSWGPADDSADQRGCARGSQKEYRGAKSTTKSGKKCQSWNAQSPHQHARTPDRYPNSGLIKNYCRNPGNWNKGAWCYTMESSTRYEACGVPDCGDVTINLEIKTCKDSDSGTSNHITIRLYDDQKRRCTITAFNTKQWIKANKLHKFYNLKCHSDQPFRIDKLTTLYLTQEYYFGDVPDQYCVDMVKVIPQDKGPLKGVEIKTKSPMGLWIGWSWEKITSALDINDCGEANPCQSRVACRKIELPSVSSFPQHDYKCFCEPGGWISRKIFSCKERNACGSDGMCDDGTCEEETGTDEEPTVPAPTEPWPGLDCFDLYLESEPGLWECLRDCFEEGLC